MQLDEAVAIQQYVLKGIPVHGADLQEARKVIRAHQGASGENRSWMPAPLSTAQRDRINLVLIAKLAMACGKLDAWKPKVQRREVTHA